MLRNSVNSILQGLVYTGPIPELDGALCFENVAIKPEAFFPEKRKFTSYNRMAKNLCKECPVIGECLEYALVNNIQEGIWGGTSREDRKNLRRIKEMVR